MVYVGMQVDRATLEKEMADLGLDMTDKDDVRTCILEAFPLLCISVGNTLDFVYHLVMVIGFCVH